MTELAQRAVACKGWRWLPGMLAQTPEGTRVGRVVERVRTGGVRLAGGGDVGWRCVPDLSDPATVVGCLLALVREAWGDPAAHAVPDGDWHVYGDMPETEYGTGDTEAAALVAALEAAP
jgi:hypothetical protein